MKINELIRGDPENGEKHTHYIYPIRMYADEKSKHEKCEALKKNNDNGRG